MESLQVLLNHFNSETTVSQLDFKSLAKLILNEYQIQSVSGSLYAIEEIEFYFFNQHHKDTSTHRHSLDVGQWRVHYSGIDIAFQGCNDIPKSCTSAKCENCKMDCTYSYGGILIRSIRNGDVTISGPLRVQTTLLSGGGITGSMGLQLIKCNSRTIELDSTKRVGINNPEIFKVREYGFYNPNNHELSAIIGKRTK